MTNENSFSKNLIRITASVFLVVLAVCVGKYMMGPQWFSNIKAEVTSQPYSRTITVTAEGKLNVKPDIAIVNLSVVTQGTSVKTVVKAGNEKMDAVVAAVKALKIEDKDITSSNYSLYPTYDYNYSPYRITGYTLSQEIRVKIRDLEIVEDVLDKGIAAGANQVGQLSFDIDDLTAVKKTARKDAFDEARAKAVEMCDAANVKLGRVVTFSEGYDSYPQPVYANYMKSYDSAGAVAESATIEPGSKDITVNVTITYEIE